MILTRIYGPYLCSHCRRIPRLGWVYRCTQDYVDGLVGFTFAPPSEPEESSANARSSMTATMHAADDGANGDSDQTIMKAWQLKANAEGHYTSEQWETVKQQRRRALATIAEASVSFHQEQHKMRESVVDGAASDTSPAAGAAGPTRRSTSIKARGAPAIYPVPQVLTPPASPSSTCPPAQLVPSCTYQCCSGCRPSSRDRTWQCVDGAHYASSNAQHPNIAFDNRPLAAPDLIQSAHHRVTHARIARRPTWPGRGEDAASCCSSSSSVSSSLGYSPQPKPAPSAPPTALDPDFAWPTPALFRASRGWKGTAAAFMAHRHQQLRGRDGWAGSNPKTRRPPRRSMAGASAQAGAGEEADIGVVGLGIATADTDTEQRGTGGALGASAARLPGREGQHQLVREPEVGTGGEVIVEDGVAVTEEGVDLGAADIITQV